MNLSRSIAIKLIRYIFLTYFMVTLTVTSIQLYSEYLQTENEIVTSMETISQSFNRTLANAIWNYDGGILTEALNGIVNSETVVGVRVYDVDRMLEGAIGYVKDRDDNIFKYNIDQDGKLKREEATPGGVLNSLISHRFNIKGSDPNAPGIVGVGYIYSSQEVVFNRVKYGFMMIFITSIIKTLALWVIAYIFVSTIVARPLSDLINASEEMNPRNKDFSFKDDKLGKTDLIKREDEVGVLANSLEDMRKELLNRDKKINDYSVNLENKVKERTNKLAAKTKDIASMLENISLGICTVIEDGYIHREYSSHLEEILETSEIAGKNAVDLLFSNSQVGVDVKQQMKACLDSIIHSYDYTFELNRHLLLTEVELGSGPGKKNIDITWEPIYDEEDHVEKVLVTIKDVTEIRKLKEDVKKQKAIDKITIEIIKYGVEGYIDFHSGSIDHLDQCKKILATSQYEKSVLGYRNLLRYLHTIKGNARTCGFSMMTDSVHFAEEEVKKIIDNGSVADDSVLSENLSHVERMLDEYHNVYLSKLRNIDATSRAEHTELIDFAKKALRRLDSSKNESKIWFADCIAGQIEGLNAVPFEDLVGKLSANIHSLAEDLGIDPPDVHFDQEETFYLYKSKAKLLSDVFVHCMRNSLDHGIECKEMRVQAGKREKGSIFIKVSRSQQSLQIDFWDDGVGLNIGLLREKYSTDGRDHSVSQGMSDKEVADLIFSSGVSTAEKVTDISGRGVGMDAIRGFLQENEGDIGIVFTNDVNAERQGGFRPFKFTIKVPISFIFDRSSKEELSAS